MFFHSLPSWRAETEKTAIEFHLRSLRRGRGIADIEPRNSRQLLRNFGGEDSFPIRRFPPPLKSEPAFFRAPPSPALICNADASHLHMHAVSDTHPSLPPPSSVLVTCPDEIWFFNTTNFPLPLPILFPSSFFPSSAPHANSSRVIIRFDVLQDINTLLVPFFSFFYETMERCTSLWWNSW